MVQLLQLRRYVAPVLATGLFGCSMHPLPENFPLNFPRASTYDIVQRIRCEAKDGLDRLRQGRNKDHVEKIISATSIGYDFVFTMTEENNVTEGGLTFIRKPSNAASKANLNVGLSGSAERSRQNIRSFRIIEDLADVLKADCSVQAGANLAYPISGTLRVDDVVRTYIKLELITDFDDKNDVDEASEVAGPARQRTGIFSEVIDFKTKLSGGLTPSLNLSAVSGSFRVTHASAELGAEREDKHSLIIAFAQDPKFDDSKIVIARRERKKIVKSKLVRGARAETALVQASSEFARNRVALELARLRHLKDDEDESAKYLGKHILKFLRPADEYGPGD